MPEMVSTRNWMGADHDGSAPGSMNLWNSDTAPRVTLYATMAISTGTCEAIP